MFFLLCSPTPRADVQSRTARLLASATLLCQVMMTVGHRRVDMLPRFSWWTVWEKRTDTREGPKRGEVLNL